MALNTKLSFAELIAKKPLPIKRGAAESPIAKAISDNYADLLAAYKAGYSIDTLAETLTEASGVSIKGATLRNKFLTLAASKGDIVRKPATKNNQPFTQSNPVILAGFFCAILSNYALHHYTEPCSNWLSNLFLMKGKTVKSIDVCSQITDSIIRELESGVMPWSKPWADNLTPVMPRRHTGERYKGINVLLLWQAAQANGYRSAFWMTYNQAKEYGAHVRKGEKSTSIIFYQFKKDVEMIDGVEVDNSFAFAKVYHVFNAEQIDDLPEKFAPRLIVETGHDWNQFQESLDWFEMIPAMVSHGGNRAYYMPSSDSIVLPNRDIFASPQAYLSTRAHESIHWTKGESRCDRDFNSKRWGDEGYAMEELVAELGAAFTMAELGHVPAIREDHAPYIASWLKVLKRDNKAILSAAGKASKALEYLCEFQSMERMRLAG